MVTLESKAEGTSQEKLRMQKFSFFTSLLKFLPNADLRMLYHRRLNLGYSLFYLESKRREGSEFMSLD
jgi:hypothetical protein